MKDKAPDYPYPHKGARKAPDKRELRILIQSAACGGVSKELHEGGIKERNTAALNFSRRFAATVMHYPVQRETPVWFRVLIEKKATVEEMAQTLRDRLHRAPTAESQEFALLMANEIVRKKGGAEAVAKHVTPELLGRLAEKAAKEEVKK